MRSTRTCAVITTPGTGTFSTLLRNSFDAALPYFSETSVDLIDLDGFQTYEAVSSGFASWLPKTEFPRDCVIPWHQCPRARLWHLEILERPKLQVPAFRVPALPRLGVVDVGKDALTGPLKALFEAKANADGERIQRYFARLGTSVIERFTSSERPSPRRRAGERTCISSVNVDAGK